MLRYVRSLLDCQILRGITRLNTHRHSQGDKLQQSKMIRNNSLANHLHTKQEKDVNVNDFCSPLSVLGFPSKFAWHALWQPTGNPVSSKGPFKGMGPKRAGIFKGIDLDELNLHPGPKSTTQSATGHPTLLVILSGRLNPLTREAAEMREYYILKDGRPYYRRNPDFRHHWVSIPQCWPVEYQFPCEDRKVNPLLIIGGQFHYHVEEITVAATIQTSCWPWSLSKIAVSTSLSQPLSSKEKSGNRILYLPISYQLSNCQGHRMSPSWRREPPIWNRW